MNTLSLCKYLISINRDLIERTAIKDCHCIGLNSFIINEKPKMRLFIAEPNCELYEKFDYKKPIIPIHPHKYDDLFNVLEGEMTHHKYVERSKLFLREKDVYSKEVEFNKYTYSRLSDSIKIENTGIEKVLYFGTEIIDISRPYFELKASDLHTVSLAGDVLPTGDIFNKLLYGKTSLNPRCSWLITETFEDKNFVQVAYHHNLVERKELYNTMESPYDYLLNYFQI